MKSNPPNPKAAPNEPMLYQIRLKGRLGQQWATSFEGLTVTLDEQGDTLLSGPVTDQAALYGLLRKVRDLGLTLLDVTHIQPGQANASDIAPTQ